MPQTLTAANEHYFLDFERSQNEGGLFDLSQWQCIEIGGPDARDYLHRMSTVDFKKFRPNEVRHGAFLTGKGQVLGLGMWFESKPENFCFVVPPGTASPVIEHIEKFHFSEQFSVLLQNDGFLCGRWAGSSVPDLAVGSKEFELNSGLFAGVKYLAWRDDLRPELTWVKLARTDVAAFLPAGLRFLGPDLFEYYRIRAGVPQFGIELSPKDILLEANFDRAVARSKGCYPGQEVVERIFTYGSVNRKLCRVRCSSSNERLPLPLYCDGVPAGTLVSMAPEPRDLKRAVGLAFVQKRFWNQGALTSENQSVTATVVV
jgi:folate-binding protein YgfZ